MQPDPASARERRRRVADGFWSRFGRLAQMKDEAEEDVLAYLAFPPEHWRQMWSNNPLERHDDDCDDEDLVGLLH